MGRWTSRETKKGKQLSQWDKQQFIVLMGQFEARFFFRVILFQIYLEGRKLKLDKFRCQQRNQDNVFFFYFERGGEIREISTSASDVVDWQMRARADDGQSVYDCTSTGFFISFIFLSASLVSTSLAVASDASRNDVLTLFEWHQLGEWNFGGGD